jgi:hypothetical protein
MTHLRTGQKQRPRCLGPRPTSRRRRSPGEARVRGRGRPGLGFGGEEGGGGGGGGWWGTCDTSNGMGWKSVGFRPTNAYRRPVTLLKGTIRSRAYVQETVTGETLHGYVGRLGWVVQDLGFWGGATMGHSLVWLSSCYEPFYPMIDRLI